MRDYLIYNNKLVKASDGKLLTLHKPEISFEEPILDSVAHRVRFFNFDGTLLSKQYVVDGQNAKPPVLEDMSVAGYKRPALTFQGWNWNTNNVKHPIDCGAIWITADGKTYLYITLTTASGLSPTLYFTKSSSARLYVDWGDGSNITNDNSGAQSATHTYASANDYCITMYIDSDTYYLGNGSQATTIFGENQKYRNILTNVYIGANVSELGGDAFYNCHNLKTLSIPVGTLVSFSATDTAYSLKALIVPNGVTSLNTWIIANCRDLAVISLPDSLIILGPGSMASQAYGLDCYIIPKGITTIPSRAFTNLLSYKKIIFLSDSVPTLENIDAFSSMNVMNKIYFKDNLVAAAKVATNWVTYADYIYPMSQLAL